MIVLWIRRLLMIVTVPLLLLVAPVVILEWIFSLNAQYPAWEKTLDVWKNSWRKPDPPEAFEPFDYHPGSWFVPTALDSEQSRPVEDQPTKKETS